MVSSDPSLSQSTAQRQIFDYFAQSLRSLPPATTLGMKEPRPGMGSQDPGTVGPCDDNDQTGSGPVDLVISLWVHGVPQGQEPRYFDMFSTAFEQNGWKVQHDNSISSRIVRGFTKDGYALIAQLNSVGGLSLSASSPCFPRANARNDTPQPSTVPHP